MQRTFVETVSLDALRVFARVARLGGFTAAARELSVTQSAVSRRIALLEAHLGLQLFDRAGRRIALTPEGERLLSRVEAALEYLGAGLQDLAGPPPDAPVTLAASASVSHLWLAPRLRAFNEAHPDTPVRVLTTDSLSDLADPRHDLTILYSTGSHPDWSLQLIWPEDLAPVASPELLARLGLTPPLSVETVIGMPLVDYARANPYWVTLRGWLSRVPPGARAPTPDVTYSTYALAVEAALRGDGVILGSAGLLQAELSQGRLVDLGAPRIETGYGYYLGLPRNRAISPGALALSNALLSSGPARPPD